MNVISRRMGNRNRNKKEIATPYSNLFFCQVLCSDQIDNILKAAHLSALTSFFSLMALISGT